MYTLVHALDLTPENRRTATFEGASFDAGISFFHVNNDPGEGPELHAHPYSETWVVLAGRVQFTAGDDHIDARPGDIMTVTAGTPHTFRNVGNDRLELMCIHASPTFITDWLEGDLVATP